MDDQKDKRISCKYGAKCYQKNPTHHEQFKHPPKRKTGNSPAHSKKKLKTEDKVLATKSASDSEDYSIQDDSDTDSEKYEKEKNKKVNNDVSESDNDSSQNNDSDMEEKEDSDVEKNSRSENVSIANIDPSPTPTVSSQDSGVVETKIEKNGTENENTENKFTLSSKEEEWLSFIKEKFLVTMPTDFFQFWNFCQKLKPMNPLEALKEVGVYLVGPFDVLAGKFSGVTKSQSEYLIHWRYYRDPPELQTVLRSDDPSGYHIGYFRDAPDAAPVLLVSNSPKNNGILTPMGGNIFSAVKLNLAPAYVLPLRTIRLKQLVSCIDLLLLNPKWAQIGLFLEDLKKSGNPFKKMAIGRIQAALTKETDRLKLDLSRKTKAMISRERKIVARTFNKIGLCVPYDRKAQLGYRELAQNNKELEANLTKLQNAKTKEEKERCLTVLQPVFTYANIATDECDFGTGIELGWDIISHGIDSLNATAERFLVSNYKLLNMETFAAIAEAHMKNRKQNFNLSIL